MNNSSSLMFSLDVTNGLLPNSINVYVSSVDLEKDIHTSQKVDFPLPWKLDDVSHPLKPWKNDNAWQIPASNLLNILIRSNSLYRFSLKAQQKCFFALACIYLLREVRKRTRTSESAVQMVMFSKSLAVSSYCRINLGSASSVVM